jgi:hypothetical protein
MIRDYSGMTSGDSFARELMYLDERKWVDEFLPEDRRFVSKCCKDVLIFVNKRIDLKRLALKSIIDLHLSVGDPSGGGFALRHLPLPPSGELV